MLRVALVSCVLSVPLLAQDRAANPPLHVAFVGDLATARGKDFVAFLQKQFASVDAVERVGCSPERLRGADVVVLDWQQGDGLMHWLDHRTEPRRNPLGELLRWDRPTVLIGSAGLNVAADWGLPGTQG